MMKKFKVSADGDDARMVYQTDDYDDAADQARRLSVGHWLGYKVTGPSGRILAYHDGERIGYKDGNTGGWVDERGLGR